MDICVMPDNTPAIVAGQRWVRDLRQRLDRSLLLVNKTRRAMRLSTGDMTMEVGQRVSVKDDEVQKPEQLGVVFTIAQVVGAGADAFVSLQAPDGSIAEWFRADELQPAREEMSPRSPKTATPRIGSISFHRDGLTPARCECKLFQMPVVRVTSETAP